MTTIVDRGPLTGERFAEDPADCRYIQHPTDGWLGDGDPLDAGSVHILDQNLSHLSYESTRVLCVAKGPGTSHFVGGGIGANPDGYDNLQDATRPVNQANQWFISWSGDVSAYLGTFSLILDGDYATRSSTLGWLRVVLRYNANSGSSTTFWAAATYDGALPLSGNGLAGAAHFGAAGTHTVALDLNVSRTITAGAGRPWQCRPSGESGYESTVYPVSVWVGWKMDHALDALYTMSVYECRLREI